MECWRLQDVFMKIKKKSLLEGIEGALLKENSDAATRRLDIFSFFSAKESGKAFHAHFVLHPWRRQITQVPPN